MSTDLDQLYQQIILDHAKERHGSGLREAPAGSSQGQSHQLNPVCGDEITLRVAEAGRHITDISWEGNGCAISMASASVLSTMAEEGIAEQDFLALVDTFRTLMRSRGRIEADEDVLGDAAALSGVAKFPARVKCAMLAWVAAEQALLAAQG